jgi:small subunit ribosomal protein S3
MGQKVNPNGFRTGVNKDWLATWSAPKKEIANIILEDHKIRKFLTDNYGIKAGMNNCSISKITIERPNTRVIVNIFTARPGMLIGQKGAGIDIIKNKIQKVVGAKTLELNIKEVKNIDCNADLVAQSVATQIEKRIAWRRAMKMAIQKAMKCGITGIKIMIAGRLDGADIARSEHYHEGVLPLHTLRSDIDYGFAESHTTFGVIGVKCWVCNGEVKGKKVRTGEVVRSAKERPNFKRYDSGDKKPFRAERKYDGGERKDINPSKNAGGFTKAYTPKLRTNNESADTNGTRVRSNGDAVRRDEQQSGTDKAKGGQV